MANIMIVAEKTGSDGMCHTYCDTFAALGNNTVIAAPTVPARRIVILAFTIQNESVTPTTMILRSGSSTNGWRVLAQNQGDGLSKTFSPGHAWKLNQNEPLILNLSGTNSCSCSVQYLLDVA